MHARGWTHAAGVAVLVGLLAAACATTEPTPTPTPVVAPSTAPSVDPSPTPPEGASLARVSATGSSTCIVRDDGTLACWGEGAPDPPAGTFRTVSTGFMGSCGIRGDGTLTCWGSGSESVGAPPEGAFLSVSAGSYTACGIRMDETLACWGGGEEGLATQPGAIRDVSVAPGSGEACAVRGDGSLVCWSVDGMEETPGREEPGPFAAVSIADGFGCAVREDGRLTCWGEGIEPEERHGEADPPDGRFRDVATGATHACALADDGAITCWGDDREGQASPPPGSFVAVSAGGHHTCAERADGDVTCWGSDAEGRVSLEAGAARMADAVPVRAAAVSAGNQQTCILAPDGSLACWGESAAQPMTGHFVALSAGDSMACAIDVAGRIHCSNDSVAAPPDGRFVDIDAKEGACAIRDDGRIVCWGGFSEDLMRPPAGSFTQVSLWYGQACGLLEDGQVRCWSEDPSIPSPMLSGTFSEIALGTPQLCGIRLTDDTIECVGGEEGVATEGPPTGTFLDIEAGARFCGLRTDHTLTCWGGFEEEQTVEPPGGTFAAMDAGGGHDCGIRTDGQLECWGLDRAAITPRIQALVLVDSARRQGRSFPITWSASSPFGQIASYDVLFTSREPGGQPGTPTRWQLDTRATSGRFRGEPGTQYCFSVRARDARGVVSDWTRGDCASLPHDDRLLDRSAGWRLRTGNAYYESTATTSSRRGATLTTTLDPAVAIAIVATTCPTCGTIRVSIDGVSEDEDVPATEPVTISLRSPTRMNGQLLPGLMQDEGLSGTLRIEVVSDDGQVIIDGIQVWTE